MIFVSGNSRTAHASRRLSESTPTSSRRAQGGRDGRRRGGGDRAGGSSSSPRTTSRPRPVSCRSTRELLASIAVLKERIVRERRHRLPLPLGGEVGPWLERSDGASAGRNWAHPQRAYLLAAAPTPTSRSAARCARSRPPGGARSRAPRRGGGQPHHQAGCDSSTRFRQLDVPIILLVGGATGTGKSTIATEAAHRLGITRVTSTDFIRQTMRAFFSPAFMPSVHYSSFEAGLALTKAEEDEAGDAGLLGFLDQTRNVLVGVKAAIDRSLPEGWSLVLEGIHIVPGMVDFDPERRRCRPMPRRDRGRGSPPQPPSGCATTRRKVCVLSRSTSTGCPRSVSSRRP